MTNRTSTRHNLPVALLLTALLLLIPATSAGAMVAQARSPRPMLTTVSPHAVVPPRICPVPWRRGPWWVRRLVVCAATYYRVPGGISEALYIANREEVARSNGHSNIIEGGHYEGDEWVIDPRRGLIMLSGKRVPPHPAMTKRWECPRRPRARRTPWGR